LAAPPVSAQPVERDCDPVLNVKDRESFVLTILREGERREVTVRIVSLIP
jgi:hypothetical protein